MPPACNPIAYIYVTATSAAERRVGGKNGRGVTNQVSLGMNPKYHDPNLYEGLQWLPFFDS